MIVLLLFSLINLLSYAGQIKFVSALAKLFLLLFTPLLLIITFNRLKNTIITTIPAFILSFLIYYLLLVLAVSTADLEMTIPLDTYFRNTAIVYFVLLFLAGLILPVSNKEITYEKIDKDNKKLNLIKIFNELITLNLKASINRLEYTISCIFAFILPIFMVFLSYKLVILLRIFYRSNLNAANILIRNGSFEFDVFGPDLLIFKSFAVCIAVTIILFFLLFILRLNDITKNFTVKLFIITSYIMLITVVIVTEMQVHIVLIPVFTILLFMIPAFIKVKVIDENKDLKINN